VVNPQQDPAQSCHDRAFDYLLQHLPGEFKRNPARRAKKKQRRAA